MKKCISVLTILMLALVLVACGGAKETETETDIGIETEIGIHAHEFEAVATKEATCTESGSKTWVCRLCGEKSISFSTPMVAHTPSPEATCTTNQICTVCENELVAAFGHNLVGPVVEPSTCYTAGKEVIYCKNCDLRETTPLPLVEHTIPNPKTVPATCKSDGSHTGLCTVCGQTDAQNTIPALSHTVDQGTWRISADGSYTTSCTTCKQSVTYKAGATLFKFDFDAAIATEKTQNPNAVSFLQNGENVTDGDRKVLSIGGSPSYIDYSSAAFADVDYYTVSLDFKFLDDGPAGKFGSIFSYTPGFKQGKSMTTVGYNWVIKRDVDTGRVGLTAKAGDNKDGNSVVCPKNVWHNMFLIVNASKGTAEVFINGTYIGVRKGIPVYNEKTIATYSDYFSFRFTDGGVGPCMYDNFAVTKIVAQTPAQ